MRHQWKTAKLADLCEFRNGLWKGKKPPYIHVGVIRNTNFRADGSLDDSDIAFLDVEEKQFSKRQLQYGDLILEKSGGGPKQPVGRVILFDKEEGLYSFSNFTSVIRVLDAALLDFNYLHRLLYWYYWSGITESMQRRSTGIRNLDFNAYKELPVPLPPLPEQKRIVAILDEAFAGIATAVANTEKNLANARELFEGYLNSVFSEQSEGWNKAPLERHIRFIDYRGKTPNKTERGLRLITAKNVKMGVLKRNPEEFVSPDSYDVWMTRGIPRKGDVLFTTEAPLGMVCQLNTDEKVVFAQRIIIMQPDPEVLDSEFVMFALRSKRIQTRIHEQATGATATGIKASLLKKIAIPFPTRPEQENIVQRVKGMENDATRLETIYHLKLTALAELKQSLLQKAFSGELTTEPEPLKEEEVA